MEWMPIETAPKDGTRVMLSNEYGTWMAEYLAFYTSGARANIWFSSMLNHNHIPKPGRYARPTHWMPLPPPPTDRRTPEQAE